MEKTQEIQTAKEKHREITTATIVAEKEERSKTLKDLRVKYMVVIYRDVLSHVPIKTIHKDLLKATINSKVQSRVMLKYFMGVAKKCKKQDRGKNAYWGVGGLTPLADSVYDIYKKDEVKKKSNRIIYDDENDWERKKKKKQIDDVVDIGRKEGKIFYFCSRHLDSAEDHEPWQGQLYVDRYWHNYDKDGSLTAYVRTHNLRTLQWVISKPVFMLTRPNCRHFMVQYSIEEVLQGKAHPPVLQKEGDRDYQTPKGYNIKQLEDELKILEGMNEVHSTKKLRQRILKIKILLKKLKGQR